ncbi:phage portal protein [Streptomyces sp. NBC_01799]|nr:phage portal protein [Streptomyces sp. NBC_01800]WSA77082.1 phage portal protein [Streptomyces sp. NBC_01799]
MRPSRAGRPCREASSACRSSRRGRGDASWCTRTPEPRRSLRTFLLPPGEYRRFDVDARLRAKTKDRYEAYASAINNGFMSRDEVRALEDLPPLANGQGAGFVQPLNMAQIGPQPAA